MYTANTMTALKLFPINCTQKTLTVLDTMGSILKSDDPYGLMMCDIVVGEIEDTFALGHAVALATAKYGKPTVLFAQSSSSNPATIPTHPLLSIVKVANDNDIVVALQQLIIKHFPDRDTAACASDVCAV